MANLATNFQDLVAKVKNLVALAPVLGAILRPVKARETSGLGGKQNLLRHFYFQKLFINFLLSYFLQYMIILYASYHCKYNHN